MDTVTKEKQRRIEAYQSGDVAWYEEEFLDLHLGDKRLDMRFGMIMNYRMQNPNINYILMKD